MILFICTTSLFSKEILHSMKNLIRGLIPRKNVLPFACVLYKCMQCNPSHQGMSTWPFVTGHWEPVLYCQKVPFRRCLQKILVTPQEGFVTWLNNNRCGKWWQYYLKFMYNTYKMKHCSIEYAVLIVPFYSLIYHLGEIHRLVSNFAGFRLW